MRSALVLVFMFALVKGSAQKTEDSVKQTINHLFSAMKSGNRELLSSVFTDSALLQTVSQDNTTGKISVRNESVARFIKQIASLPANAADERITFETVKIDADLASVWTPYQFYYNGLFSHCGVNSFQLVRIAGQWKVHYLIDTRRKEKCAD